MFQEQTLDTDLSNVYKTSDADVIYSVPPEKEKEFPPFHDPILEDIERE